jgi:hypothetical protein
VLHSIYIQQLLNERRLPAPKYLGCMLLRGGWTHQILTVTSMWSVFGEGERCPSKFLRLEDGRITFHEFFMIKPEARFHLSGYLKHNPFNCTSHWVWSEHRVHSPYHSWSPVLVH